MPTIFYSSVTVDPSLPPEVLAAVERIGTAEVHTRLRELGPDESTVKVGRRVTADRARFVVDRELDEHARSLQARLNQAANTLLMRGGLSEADRASLRGNHWSIMSQLRVHTQVRALAATLSTRGGSAKSEAADALAALESSEAAVAEDIGVLEDAAATASPAPQPEPQPEPMRAAPAPAQTEETMRTSLRSLVQAMLSERRRTPEDEVPASWRA